MVNITRKHILNGSVETSDIADSAITTAKIADSAITKAKVSPKFIQAGRTSVTFPFAATGEENVSASISFPTAFDSTPAVIASVEGADVGIVKIEASTTGFTITVRDDKGTDYTADTSATVNWIAIAV